MKTPRFEGPFKWSTVRAGLLSLREDVQSIEKVPGHNVTIDEHRSKGKVINVASDRRPTGGGGVGACCYDDGTCDNLTESDCTEAGGNWQGEDTTCDDTGVCVGACCEGEDGTTCVDNSTPDSCAADGGTWTDFGVTCSDDPPPCAACPDPCPCCDTGGGFPAYDDSGRRFMRKTVVCSFSDSSDTPKCGGMGHSTASVDTIDVYTYDPVTCELSCIASGSFSHDVTVTGNGAPPAGELHCNGTRTVCGSSTTHTDIYDCSGAQVFSGDATNSDVGVGAEYYPSNACLNPTGDVTIDSTATTYVIDFNIGTVTATLSGEFSCP